MPPKLPPNPFQEFPKPPRISQILKKANPVREVVDDARELIKSGRDEVSGIASALRVEGEAPPVPPEEEVVEIETGEDEIAGGTAGNICSDEHIVQCASDITEALRMARSRGIKDPEIRKRLQEARSELNQMERFDLVAEKIASYPKEQQEIARWLLPKSAAIRHTINEILMRDKEIEDLEKLTAYANSTRNELTDRIDSLPREQKESDACLEIKKLPVFLEQKRLERGEIGIKDIHDYLKKEGKGE